MYNKYIVDIFFNKSGIIIYILLFNILNISHTHTHTQPTSVHGILQARILEWVAMPFSRGSSQLGIKLASLASPASAGGLFTTSAATTNMYKCVQKYIVDLSISLLLKVAS